MLSCFSFCSLSSSLCLSISVFCFLCCGVVNAHLPLLRGIRGTIGTSSARTKQILEFALGPSNECRSNRLFLDRLLRFGTKHATTRLSAAAAFLNVLLGEWAKRISFRNEGCNQLRLKCDLLEVVIIGQLFSSHDPPRTGEQCHSRLPTDRPLDHLAVGFTRVIDKACDCSPGRINDHFVIETHEVVALPRVS